MVNKNTNFVLDFFDLGPNKWVEKYTGNIPDGMTPELFAAEIHKHGLQLRFIDSNEWEKLIKLNLPVYLVKDEHPKQPYVVFAIDRLVPNIYGRYSSLEEGILYKCKNLFVDLRLGYLKNTPIDRPTPQKIEADKFFQFVGEFFSAGQKTWILQYAGNVPKGMDAKKFVELITEQGLELDFLDENNMQTSKKLRQPIFLVKQKGKSEAYSLFSFEGENAKVHRTYSSLQDAILGKAEYLLWLLQLPQSELSKLL